MAGKLDLTPERARIFRITHIDNVPWILSNGLHCGRSSVRYPGFVQIGNSELIAKRMVWPVPIPPGGNLHDYVPFYFTPFSPMLYNIKTGWNGITRRPMKDLAILVSSLHAFGDSGVDFVFTDRHAYSSMARFSSKIDDLGEWVDWEILQARDFARDPNDLGKVERYQAEALAHGHVPVAALSGVVCCFEDAKRERIGIFLATEEAAPFTPALERTSSVIDGFESALGMELLATVDWLLLNGTAATTSSVREALVQWPGGRAAGQRKLKLFDERLVNLAIQRLSGSVLSRSGHSSS